MSKQVLPYWMEHHHHHAVISSLFNSVCVALRVSNLTIRFLSASKNCWIMTLSTLCTERPKSPSSSHMRDMIQVPDYVVSAIAWCFVWGQWQRDLLDFTKRDSVNVKLSIKSIVFRRIIYRGKNSSPEKKMAKCRDWGQYISTRHFILQS